MIRKLCTNLKHTLVMAMLAAALAVGAVAVPQPAVAAVTNYSAANSAIVVIPLHFTGTISATTAAVAKFNMPFPCKMIGVGAVPRALTGSSNTVDVLLGGVSILSGAMAMTAGTYTEGTITTSTITDEGVITVNVTIPSGTLVDTTVLMTCLRR